MWRRTVCHAPGECSWTIAFFIFEQFTEQLAHFRFGRENCGAR